MRPNDAKRKRPRPAKFARPLTGRMVELGFSQSGQGTFFPDGYRVFHPGDPFFDSMDANPSTEVTPYYADIETDTWEQAVRQWRKPNKRKIERYRPKVNIVTRRPLLKLVWNNPVQIVRS